METYESQYDDRQKQEKTSHLNSTEFQARVFFPEIAKSFFYLLKNNEQFHNIFKKES
jgi:hypothetical protein